MSVGVCHPPKHTASFCPSGWEYRHWDALIQALAVATEEETPPIPDLRIPQAEVPLVVQQGWASTFGEGGTEGPETVEVWAEGHYLTVLKAILVNSSKVQRKSIQHPLLNLYPGDM